MRILIFTDAVTGMDNGFVEGVKFIGCKLVVLNYRTDHLHRILQLTFSNKVLILWQRQHTVQLLYKKKHCETFFSFFLIKPKLKFICFALNSLLCEYSQIRTTNEDISWQRYEIQSKKKINVDCDKRFRFGCIIA